MKRHVLVVADVSACEVSGGAERMLARHVRTLAEAGFRVTVLTRQRHPQDAPVEEVMPGAVEHRLAWSGDRGPRGMLELRRAARRWLMTHAQGFDAVVAEQPFVLAALISAGFSQPYLYCCYSFAFEEYATRHALARGACVQLKLQLIRTLEARVYRRAARLLVLSDYTARRLEEAFAIPRARVRIAPGGAERVSGRLLKERAEIRRALGWTGPRVITVRNLVPRTGVDMLPQCAYLLKDRFPELHWEIVGTGPLLAPIRALAQGLGVDARMHLAGFLDDREVQRRMIAADVFVLPTRSLEGFGLVTAEANMAGLPVVATPVGANPEVVQRVPGNRLAARPDPEAIAEAVAETLAQWSERGLEARVALMRAARRAFDWRLHAEALLEEVERLCGSRI